MDSAVGFDIYVVVLIYSRGTSNNDAPKQIIVCDRLKIDCCFKISA
jgi:hypothetical protein